MAIIRQFSPQNDIIIGFWQITETVEELLHLLENCDIDNEAYDKIKNENRRKQWLAARCLVKTLTQNNHKILYTDCGKPFVETIFDISITHTQDIVCVILSNSQKVGIDIEYISSRIEKIAHKFLNETERNFIDKNNYHKHLFACWGAKEALYKLYGERNLIFDRDMIIAPFEISDEGTFSAQLITNDLNKEFYFKYFTFDNYMLVWTCCNMIYKDINENIKKGKKLVGILIDPGKLSIKDLVNTVKIANKSKVNYILVGGSIISEHIDICIETIKKHCKIPVLLFPGSLMQVTEKADGILFLSLISGRNADFLIGNHVIAAPILKKSKIEVIPTGYILVENGKTTAVEYMSNTRPIPKDKTDIAVATAMAGELLGLKMIYLEAGSGASSTVSSQMISEIKSNINCPLIVGGGIRSKKEIQQAFKSGADMVILGTIVEENPDFLLSL
jgi:putative glycerol-1-phosphate prenyltransferase